MAREDPHFRLRIPEALKAKIEAAAAAKGHSMTAEIVQRLWGSFQKNVPLPSALSARITLAAKENNRSLIDEALRTLEEKYPPHMLTVDQLLRSYRVELGNEDTTPAREKELIEQISNIETLLGEGVTELEWPVKTEVEIVRTPPEKVAEGRYLAKAKVRYILPIRRVDADASGDEE